MQVQLNSLTVSEQVPLFIQGWDEQLSILTEQFFTSVSISTDAVMSSIQVAPLRQGLGIPGADPGVFGVSRPPPEIYQRSQKNDVFGINTLKCSIS